jgi:isocitrate/isopropylmalate dehydrogenase
VPELDPVGQDAEGGRGLQLVAGLAAWWARRVTCVDNSNVLRSYAFFRAVFNEVPR